MGDETQQTAKAAYGRRGRRIALGAAAVLVTAGLAASVVPSAFAADASAAPAAASTSWCQSADLTIRWQGISSEMSHHEANLIFTNTGDTTCHLGGYSTMTFVDATGTAVGLPAEQIAVDDLTEKFVDLAPGGTTTAQARRVNAEVFDTDLCQIVTAAGISVLPPGNTTAVLVPLAVTACSGDIGRSLLDIGAIGTSFVSQD
jgi:hypothetical protein